MVAVTEGGHTATSDTDKLVAALARYCRAVMRLAVANGKHIEVTLTDYGHKVGEVTQPHVIASASYTGDTA